MKLDANKIIEYFNNLNDQMRYCFLVGVVFLIILIDVLILVLPQLGAIDNVNNRAKKLSDDTQQVLVDRDRIDVLRKNLEDKRMLLKSLESKVRSIQEVPVILSTISSIANEYGVKIDSLSPEKSQQEVLKTTPEGRYYGLPVVIKARCGYHKFGHFLNTLENEDLYFILKDFIIQNDDKSPNMHLFSITINIILVNRSWSQTKNL